MRGFDNFVYTDVSVAEELRWLVGSRESRYQIDAPSGNYRSILRFHSVSSAHKEF